MQLETLETGVRQLNQILEQFLEQRNIYFGAEEP